MLITNKNELKKFAPDQRIWQGIPSVEVTSGGKVYYTFYGGGIKEQFGNYCILKTCRTDFTDHKIIAVEYQGNDGRSYDPCLWIDPLNRLWWIFNVMPNHATYATICENPDADEPVFGKPFKIGYDVMLNKPTVLSTGEWLFSIAVWGTGVLAVRDCFTPHRDKKAFVYKSVNNGETFTKLGGAAPVSRSFDEHMIIEKKDGTLAMYIRTRYGIGVSYSCDGGNNWSNPVNSWLGGPDSRFFIRRLKSGRLLLVNHYNFKGRNNLTAMLSEDDGETWKGYLLLDERANVSYPDAIEASDGYIYITYDRERGAFLHRLNDALSKPREILIAKVTEEDILAGKIVSKGSELKVVVDKLTEYNGEDKDPYCEIVKDKDEYVRMLAKKETGNEIVDKLFEDYGRCCMSLSESSRQIVDENCELLIDEEKTNDVLSRVVAIEKIISVLGEEISEDYQYSAYVIERVKNIVNDNVSTVGFSLNDVAEQLNVSKYYVCHLFKNRVGITVLQYINHRRLATAKLLLVNSDKSILAISIAVGFVDAAYFSKWFKRMEGITPMAYRNLNKIN